MYKYSHSQTILKGYVELALFSSQTGALLVVYMVMSAGFFVLVLLDELFPAVNLGLSRWIVGIGAFMAFVWMIDVSLSHH